MILHTGTSKEYLKRVPHALGEHAFLFTLFLIALAGGISALVFFFSLFSQEPKDTGIQAQAVELRQDVFENTLKERSLQDERMRDSKSSFPKDIFRLNR